MGWGKFTHKVRNSARKSIKKLTHHAEKITGLKGSDLGAIALSPFTAGASLAATSAAKNMFKNPMGTIEGGITGFETAGPIGALFGAVEGGGGFDSTESNSARNEADKAIKLQYEYQSKLQQQAQQWQEGMSNTAHQREVNDLKAAGLNPVLSAGGTGASTGSVGAGSVGLPDKVAEKTAKMQNRIAELTLRNELATSAKQRQLADAETYNIIASTEPNIQKTLAERANLIAQAQKAQSDKEINNAEKGLKEWNSKHPVLANFLGAGISGLASVGGSAITAGAISKAGKKLKGVNVINPTISTTAPASARQLLGI